MEEEFDYEIVPKIYAHCFNAECTRREECLRYVVGQACTNKRPTVNIVNPKCIPDDTATCPYFKSVKKIRVAWGLKDLLKDVPYAKAVHIRNQLIGCFGKPLYYRFYRGEYPITVREHQIIKNVFHNSGVTATPTYERYSYIYDF